METLNRLSLRKLWQIFFQAEMHFYQLENMTMSMNAKVARLLVQIQKTMPVLIALTGTLVCRNFSGMI